MNETVAHLDECPFCHHIGVRVETRHIGRNCKVGHNVAYVVCQKCWCKGPMARDDKEAETTLRRQFHCGMLPNAERRI